MGREACTRYRWSRIIGSHLVEALIEMGCKVRVADNFFVKPKLLKSNVEALKLLYETDLRIRLQLSLIVTIGVGLYAIFIWLNVIWPSIPSELRFTPEAGLIQAIYALQLLYLILGLWFSYFGPIHNRLAKIRDVVISKTYS